MHNCTQLRSTWNRTKRDLQTLPFKPTTSIPPKNIKEWNKITKKYFDPKTQVWIQNILTQGSDFGLDPQSLPQPRVQCRSITNDPATCLGIAATVRKWYTKNLISGPYSRAQAHKLQVTASPAFGVPKPDGSTRPVIDYSNKGPSGESVNSQQREEYASVKYVSLKSIVAMTYTVGPSAWLWARDLKDGYFNIWLNPALRKYGTFFFANMYWIPNVLMFGFTSAPCIFTKFMHVPLKAIRMENPKIMYQTTPTENTMQLLTHNEPDVTIRNNLTATPLVRNYLDDIIGVAPTQQLAQQQFSHCDTVLRRLGLAPQTRKDKPPTTRIEILGAIVDTVQQRLFLSPEKLKKYSSFITEALAHQFITKRTLLRIIGRIRYSATFCRPLAAYARNMEQYAYKLTQLDHHRRITQPMRLDLDLIIWGLQQAASVGTSFKAVLGLEPHTHFASTDAAGTHGGIGGALHTDNGLWFQVPWSQVSRFNIHTTDIEWKELAAVVVMVELLKHSISGQKLHIQCDNLPVVHMVINFRAPLNRNDLQTLLRYLATSLIQHQITLWIQHLDGPLNIVADRLSRFKNHPFKTALWKPQPLPANAQQTLQHLIDLCF